jgi:HEAT repeat protein
LILLLKDSNESIRHYAAEALGIIGDKAAVEPLMAALQGDRRNRSVVAAALGTLGDPRAVEPLIAGLQEGGHDWERQAIVQALGKLRDPRAADALVGVIEHEAREAPGHARGEVTRAAVEALLKIGDPRTIEPLTTLLHQGQFAAAEVIMGLLPPTDPLTQAWCAVASRDWKRAVDLGQVAIRPLIKGLETFGASFLREASAKALGEIGQAESVEALIAALQDKDVGVRGAAAAALGKTGDARAVEPLVACLHDVDEYVRTPAARALGEIGDPRALNALAMASRDRVLMVREFAQEAIQAIKGRAPQN